MNNPNNNQNTNNNGKRLKKVKRPIRRMPPQNPQVAGSNVNPFNQAGNNQNQNRQVNESLASPFNQSENSPNNIPEQNPQKVSAFDLDQYLDSNENLPALTNEVSQNQQPEQSFLGEDNFDDLGMGGDLAQPKSTLSSQEKKLLLLVTVFAFILGFVVAKFFFTEQKIVKDGLQGVVVNAEVPRGRARCGLAERTQGCVLYLMNPQKQELSARDFYDLASQLTGRQRFVIETGNMRYSNTKIKPGEIGQFNIPPLTN